MRGKMFFKIFFALMAVIVAAVCFIACDKSGSAKPESLLLTVDAPSTCGVNEVFEPTVTVSDGASYTLTVVSCPEGKEIPEATDGAFVPSDLGKYAYKITASKDGYENKEYIGEVTAVDGESPSISGDIEPIILDPDVNLTVTLADIVAGLSVTDNYDGSIDKSNFVAEEILCEGADPVSLNAEDTTYEFEGAGEYEIRYSVSDSSNNKGYVLIPVTVKGLKIGGDIKKDYFVDDRLVLPQCTVYPQSEQNTLKFKLNGTDVNVEDLPFMAKAHDSLVIEYSNGKSETVALTVKDFEIACNEKKLGEELSFADVYYVNDKNATVSEIKVTEEGGTDTNLTSAADRYTFERRNNYTILVTLSKNGKTHEINKSMYVTDDTELLSFESSDSGKNAQLDPNPQASTSGCEVSLMDKTVNGQSNFVKYGRYALKVKLPAVKNGYATVPVGSTQSMANTSKIKLYVYAVSDCVIRAIPAGTGNPHWTATTGGAGDTGHEIKLTGGQWNEVETVFDTVTVSGAKLEYMYFANAGGNEAEFSVDCVRFVNEIGAVENKSVSKEIVKGHEANVTEHFEVVGNKTNNYTVQYNVKDDAGSVTTDGKYTAPSDVPTSGKAVVTVTLTENGVSSSIDIEFTIIAYEREEGEVLSFDSAGFGAGATKYGSFGMVEVIDDSENIGISHGKGLKVTMSDSSKTAERETTVIPDCTSKIGNTNVMKARIYLYGEVARRVRITPTGNNNVTWMNYIDRYFGYSVVLQPGWNDVIVPFGYSLGENADLQNLYFTNVGYVDGNSAVTVCVDYVCFVNEPSIALKPRANTGILKCETADFAADIKDYSVLSGVGSDDYNVEYSVENGGGQVSNDGTYTAPDTVPTSGKAVVTVTLTVNGFTRSLDIEFTFIDEALSFETVDSGYNAGKEAGNGAWRTDKSNVLGEEYFVRHGDHAFGISFDESHLTQVKLNCNVSMGNASKMALWIYAYADCTVRIAPGGDGNSAWKPLDHENEKNNITLTGGKWQRVTVDFDIQNDSTALAQYLYCWGNGDILIDCIGFYYT